MSRGVGAVPVLALTLLLLFVSVPTVVFVHTLEPPCCQAEAAPQPGAAHGDCADSVCGFLSWFLSFLPESAHVMHGLFLPGDWPGSFFQAPPDPLLHPAEFPPELA